jgi:hypothetical protein
MELPMKKHTSTHANQTTSTRSIGHGSARRLLSAATVAAIALTTAAAMGVASHAIAQTPAATNTPATPTAEKKKIFALVSAVGDQFNYVRQRESTGSNIIDNNNRRTVKVENNVLNLAVLRGLDSAIANAHPDSERVFITLNPAEMEGVLPQKREEVAIGKIVAALEKMPQRMTWENIIVATPKYLFSESSGMGPKLQGMGIYVRSVESARLEQIDAGDGVVLNIDGADLDTEKGTVDPNTGKKNKLSYQTYIAPFSFIRVYVIDPKTMTVVEKNARHDFTKFVDPNATALDVGRSISADVLGPRIASLIERSAARAVGETALGATVEIRELTPAAAAAKPAAPSK